MLRNKLGKMCVGDTKPTADTQCRAGPRPGGRPPHQECRRLHRHPHPGRRGTCGARGGELPSRCPRQRCDESRRGRVPAPLHHRRRCLHHPAPPHPAAWQSSFGLCTSLVSHKCLSCRIVGHTIQMLCWSTNTSACKDRRWNAVICCAPLLQRVLSRSQVHGDTLWPSERAGSDAVGSRRLWRTCRAGRAVPRGERGRSAGPPAGRQ